MPIAQDVVHAEDLTNTILDISDYKDYNINAVAVPWCPTCRFPGAFVRIWQ